MLSHFLIEGKVNYLAAQMCEAELGLHWGGGLGGIAPQMYPADIKKQSK